MFNSQSCVSCHELGGTGGAGTSERNIEIATAIDPTSQFNGGYYYAFSMSFGSEGFGYRFGPNSAAASSSRARRPRAIDPNLLAPIHPGFRQSPSLVLHLFGTDPGYQSWRDKVPGFHGAIQVVVTKRNPTPLFGLGLIDAIPDSAIEAGAKRKTAVKGRVSRLKDGRIGRFGWKAQNGEFGGFRAWRRRRRDWFGSPRSPARGRSALAGNRPERTRSEQSRLRRSDRVHARSRRADRACRPTPSKPARRRRASPCSRRSVARVATRRNWETSKGCIAICCSTTWAIN